MMDRMRSVAGRLDRRKLSIGVGCLAALTVVYGVIGFFVLPGVIKSRAEQLVLQELHRPLSIRQVDVNPFRLSVTLQGVRMLEPDKTTEFVSIDRAHLNISTASLFRFAPVVQELRLTSPHVRLVRHASNRYNIDDLVELALKPKPDKESARFSLHNIQIEGGRIEFDDQPKKTRHLVEDMTLGIPFLSSLPSQVDIFVEPFLSAKVNGSPLLVKGKARPFAQQKEAAVDLQLDGIDLTRYVEYLPFEPRFRLPEGRLDLDLVLSFTQPKDQPAAVMIEGGASLKSLLLTELDGTPMLRLPELNVAGASANLSTGRHRIGKIELVKPEIHLVKEANGTFNLSRLAPEATEAAKATSSSGQEKPANTADQRLALEQIVIREGSGSFQDLQSAQRTRATADKLDLKVAKAALNLGKRSIDVEQVESSDANLALVHGRREPGQAASAAASGTKPDIAEPGFQFRIARLAIGGWSVRVEDRSQAQPAVTLVSPVALVLTDFSNAPGGKGALDLQARVNQRGNLLAKGSIGLVPLDVDLELNLKEVDILAVQPYVSNRINLNVRRANLSSQGRLQLAQARGGEFRGGFKGDANIGDLVTVDKVSGSDFVSWKRLAMTGIDARLSPLSVTVGQMALSDFFARVIINREGRINLQDIVRRGDGRQKSLTEEDDQDAPADKAAPTPVVADKPEAATPMPPIRIGKVIMRNGRARFTDNFIQPNYSAMLNNLNGTVSSLSSDAATAAAVDVRGQVSGAPLTIAGKINPLSGNLFLDIQAGVRGMELAPLSAYSAKYAGYGIEKGKLSFDVAYKIENRQLTAQNRLVLDQLVLGDKVESPSATKLPVRLALALLQDRHGVIDVNLPISGSLNDPEFSIGGIIVRAFVNLIAKAVTAPFSLLGSLFGGGEELSWLEFDDGSRAISDAGRAKLESLAKALNDRPALKLEITGRIDPEADKEGLARASIQRKVRALKRQDLAKQGKVVDFNDVAVQPAEYPALLRRVYSDEKFPKPRNFIGLLKDLPVAEMERLMIANHKVSEDDLIGLANQRAMAVSQWLQKNGKVPAERIFVVAGKSGAGHKSAKASRVDFSLR